MVRLMMPNSVGANSSLCMRMLPPDGDYAAFGMVIEGMDVVDQIASVKTDRSTSLLFHK